MSFRSLLQAGTTPYALILVTVSTSIYEAALTPLLEEAICRQHYDSLGNPLAVDKRPVLDCKAKAVQTTLAIVGGNLQLFGGLLGLLLALPYTWIVSRISKQTLLVLGAITTPMSMAYFFSICSRPQTFAITAVYFTPLFGIFGGGPPLAYTLLYSQLASTIKPDQLAASYYGMASILLLVNFVSSGVTARLLQVAPTSIPSLVMATYVANLPLYLFMTNKASGASVENELAGRYQDRGAGTSSDGDAEFLIPLSDSVISDDHRGALCGYLYGRVLKNRMLVKLCLFICFVKALAMNTRFIEVQWTSSRYSISMPEATYLESYATLVCFCVLTALPFATTPLLARLKSKQTMELRILRLSFLARAIGALGMALAPNLPLLFISMTVAAMGAGAEDTFKSLMTSICSETDVTRLYLTVTIVETVAGVVSSQLWPRLLSIGYGLADLGMAMPFVLSACLTASVYVLLFGLEVYVPAVDAETL